MFVHNQFRNLALTSTVNFDNGVMDVTGIQIGFLPAAGGTQAVATHTASVNIGGGTVTIGAGGVDMGGMTATNTTLTKTVVGSLNITGGTVTIANNPTLGASVRLVNNSGAGNVNTAQDTLNITGGTVTLAGDIIKGAIIGTANNATLTLNGGTLDMSNKNIGGTVAAANLTTINLISGTLQNVLNINTGGPLTKSGTGTLTLAGTNTYPGNTVVANGTLLVGTATAIPTGAGKGNVVLDGGATSGILDLNGLDITINGLSGISGASLGQITNGVAGSKTLTLGNNNASASYAGNILDGAGTVALTKIGTGTQTLSGFNTFSGPININAGRLLAASNSALGAFPAGTTVNGAGTGLGVVLELGNGVTISGENLTINATGGRATLLSSNTATWAGTIDIAGNDKAQISADTAAANLNISGNISGSSAGDFTLRGDLGNGTISGGISLGFTSLIKTGSGTWTISSTGNTWGSTLVAVGTLKLGVSGALPAAAVLTTGEAGQASTFNLNGFNQTVAGIADTAGATNQTITSSAGGTLTVNTATTATYGANGGVLSGSLALAKTGPGTLTLSSANTFSGGTTVTAGTLNLGTASASIGAISLTGGNNPYVGSRLRGVGSVGAISFSNTGGCVWPGSGIQVTGLTADAQLNAASADFSINGKLAVLINNSNGKKQSLNVTGNVVLGPGSILSLAYNSPATPPVSYTILTAANGAIKTAFGQVLFGPGTNYGDGKIDIIYNDTTNTTSDPNPNVNPTLGASFLGNGYNQVIVRFNSASVTPVKIADFKAEARGAGALIAWNAVSEYQNAGFNIYRRAIEGSAWMRVNPALISGRITNPDEQAYSFYDWAPAGDWLYKLESVSIHGRTETHDCFAGPLNIDFDSSASVNAETLEAMLSSVAISLSVKNADLANTAFAPAAANRANSIQHTTDSAHNLVRAQMLPPVKVRELSKKSSEAVQAAASTAAVRSIPAPSASTTGAAVRWLSGTRTSSSGYSTNKVVYDKPGVLFIPQSMLTAGYNINHLSIQRESRAVSALAVLPDGVLLYAPGYSDAYTDRDAFFLRRISGSTSTGKFTSAAGLFQSPLPVNVTSPATVTTEFHDVYFDWELRPYDIAPWFSYKYLTSGTSQSFNLSTPTAASSGPAKLTLNLWSLTDAANVAPDHALQVLLNGSAIGEAQWDGGGKMIELSFDIPAGILASGDNQIQLVTPHMNGVDSQISFVHSMNMNYTRLLDGSAPFEIVNDSPGNRLYELSNVPTPTTWVVDTRFTDRATLLPVESQIQGDGTYRLRFVAPGYARCLVVPAGQENRPLSITARQVKPVRLNGTYLATGPSQFASGVQPLLMARAKEGIKGAFLDQEQLFDYYNHGRFGPQAIQNAVRATTTKYLLLVGRTTYDYHNYSGNNVDPLCPTFLVGTSFWAQSTSDSMFGDMGRGVPEVAIGRLPVNNTAELAVAVGRITNNKGMPVSGIRAHLVADEYDPEAGDFGAQLAGLASHHADIAFETNTLGVTYQSSPEVTAALENAANGGADFILYAGHGNSIHLGRNNPNILDLNLVQAWKGNVVLLQSTCTANWMAKDQAGFKSIAIQALTQPQGGISASIASSTYMNSEYAVEFMNQLVSNANRGGQRWGSALLLAQQWAAHQTGSRFYTDLLHTEQLFGDPAMPVFSTPKRGAASVAPATPPANPNATSTQPGTF